MKQRLLAVAGLLVVVLGGWWLFSGEEESDTPQPVNDVADEQVTGPPERRQTGWVPPERTIPTATDLNQTADAQRRDEARTTRTTRTERATPPSTSQRMDEAGLETTAIALEVQKGMGLIGDGQLLDGRRALSQLLIDHPLELSRRDAQAIRDVLTSVNRRLVFSPQIAPGDTTAENYVVKPGDTLGRIAPNYKVPYQFTEMINHVQASRIRVGQNLKMVRGPFHVVVDKSDYRLDVYLREPPAPDESIPGGLAEGTGALVYVCSVPVGIGERDSTPVGRFRVSPGGRLVNPGWTNPRTGKVYDRDDPNNPIGEYWLGLQGIAPDTQELLGYGIHGTIEPESIGTQASMGCVRLRDEDIKLIYAMLWPGESTVTINP